MLDRHGEDWTLKGWSDSTRDEYEDELPTGPTETPFKAIRSDSETEDEQRDEKGQTRWEMLDLLIDAALALPATTDPKIQVTLVSPEGREYALIGVARSGIPIGAKRLKVRSGGADATLYI